MNVKTKNTYLTAMNDKMFKNVIRTKGGKRLLKVIIENAIGKEIDEIIFTDPELLVTNRYVRGKTIDLHVLSGKEIIMVEVNNKDDDKTRIRNTAYINSNYSNYVKVGEEYRDDTNFYQINLSRKSLSGKLKDEYKLWNTSHEYEFVKNYKIIEYNVTKAYDLCYNEGKKDGELEYVALFMADEKNIDKIDKENEIMQEFIKEMEKINKDDKFNHWISAEEDNRRLDKLEGKDEGRAEEKIEVAKKMLEKGSDISFISELTELSVEEIKNIQKNIQE